MRNSPAAEEDARTSPNAKERQLVEELRRLKGQHGPRQARITKAVTALSQTNSTRVRNAAALALADLQAFHCLDALIDLLTRPETKGSRGTLLYALQELRTEVPLMVLAQIIAEDSYEAREEALILIRGEHIEGSPEEFVRARAVLEAAAGTADRERGDAIRRALDFLRIRPPPPAGSRRS